MPAQADDAGVERKLDARGQQLQRDLDQHGVPLRLIADTTPSLCANDAPRQRSIEGLDVLQQVIAHHGKCQQRVRSCWLLRESRLDRLQAFAQDVMIGLVRRRCLRVAQSA